MTARILALDIETAPANVWTYSLFKPLIGVNQVEKPPEILGWATRWVGKNANTCKYRWADEPGAFEELWDQLDEATHVLHFNGKTFDIPWINHEVKKQNINGGRPPSPYKQIDLMQQVRSNMRSLSNKLQFLSTDLFGLEGKIEESALSLFLQMHRGDEKQVASARKRMERYCRQDVNLLPTMFEEVRPWLKNLALNLHAGVEDACPNCAGTNLERRGVAFTAQSAFQRFVCRDCGKWSRGTKRVDYVTRVGIQ